MYEFLRVYVLSGCIGVIEYWLFGGMKESKEEMARWTETIVLEGIWKFARVTEKGVVLRFANPISGKMNQDVI